MRIGFEGINIEKKKEFDMEEAQKAESSVLRNFFEKNTKNIALTLTLITGLCAAGEAWSFDKNESEKGGAQFAMLHKSGDIKMSQAEKGASMENLKSDKSVEYLQKIYNANYIGDENASPGKRRLNIERAVEVLVAKYAKELRNNFNASKIEADQKNVSPYEIQDALRALNEDALVFADKQFGDGDGKVDVGEIKSLQQKFQEESKGNTGLNKFRKMVGGSL